MCTIQRSLGERLSFSFGCMLTSSHNVDGPVFTHTPHIPHTTHSTHSTLRIPQADSLLAHRGFNGSDMRVRFHNWWFHGYNNAFKGSFNTPTHNPTPAHASLFLTLHS